MERNELGRTAPKGNTINNEPAAHWCQKMAENNTLPGGLIKWHLGVGAFDLCPIDRRVFVMRRGGLGAFKFLTLQPLKFRRFLLMGFMAVWTNVRSGNSVSELTCTCDEIVLEISDCDRCWCCFF